MENFNCNDYDCKDYFYKDYVKRIRRRIAASWVLLILMIVYMVAVGELGLSDSRVMSALARNVSSYILFGGIIYVISRIVHWNRILKDNYVIQAEFAAEVDERKEFLHYKSGGLLFDIMLVALLCITCVTGVSNEVAFRTSFAILLTAVSLKVIGYAVYSRRY